MPPSPLAVYARYTSPFCLKSGCGATSKSPDWPRCTTSGTPSTGSGASLPSFATRRVPRRSVISIRPSGSHATHQGRSRPSTTFTTLKACSSLFTT